MLENSPVNRAEKLVSAYVNKNWAELWSLVSSKIVYDEPATRRKTHGIKRFMSIMQEWGAAFPDSKITVKGKKIFGNTVTFDLHWTGTHDGLIDTPGGMILPTGKKIDLPASMVVEVGEDSVESVTHNFDMATMEAQIELLPEEKIA